MVDHKPPRNECATGVVVNVAAIVRSRTDATPHQFKALQEGSGLAEPQVRPDEKANEEREKTIRPTNQHEQDTRKQWAPPRRRGEVRPTAGLRKGGTA